METMSSEHDPLSQRLTLSQQQIWLADQIESDFTVAGDYARVMAVVSDYLADRPAEERDAVLGGNAQRLYNLGVTTAAGTPS